MTSRASSFFLLLAAACTAIVLGCGGRPAEATDREAAARADTVRLPATNFYEIATPLGRMVVRLYDETPLHRDNFKRLAATAFYDSTAFHRVIEGFMVQGGDPNSRDDDPDDDGLGDPGYTLPAEIRPQFLHRRGALAAARQGDHANPERRSSGSQFYLVHGQPLDPFTLGMIEQQIRQQTGNPAFAFPDSARAVYATLGGAPHLDGQYTVFGEIVEGLDVLDRIAAADTPRRLGRYAPPNLLDRPLQTIRMSVRPLPDYGR